MLKCCCTDRLENNFVEACGVVAGALVRGSQVQTPLQSACRCVPETRHPKLLLWGLSTVLSMDKASNK